MCTKIERNPGKFEGESCITKLAWEWMMDGGANEDGDTDEGTPSIFLGPFSIREVSGMCEQCQDMLLHASKLELYEDSNGFVTTKVA